MAKRRQELRGNTRDKIDRDLLHEYLWKNSEPRSNKVSVSQTDLAEALGITVFTMTRIFAEMLAGGRLRRIKGVYYVTDPQIWQWRNPAPPVPTKREIRTVRTRR